MSFARKDNDVGISTRQFKWSVAGNSALCYCFSVNNFWRAVVYLALPGVDNLTYL